MAQTVKLRRSALPGRVPNNAQLELGELSMNTTDGKIFLAKSGSNGPSVEEVIITNTQNTGSIELVGSISSSFFTGSFIGDGSRLTNIQASGVTGLSLDRIANTTATASISPSGFSVNVNTSITGSLTATSITGSGLGLTDVPFHITGSDGTSTSDKQFTKLLFDDSTGIKLTETVDGVARVYLEGVAAEGSGDGRTSKLEVTESSSIWVLTHGLNERYPAITVFDSNGDVIIPQRIETISVNQLKVYFNNPQTGVVTATLGGGLPIISASYDGRVLSVNNGVATWKDGIVSSSLQFDSTTDPFTGSFYGTFRGDIQGTANITGDFIPVLTDTYNLGSVDNQWKDLFLSSGSLYIDGTKVISSNTAELIISTDLGQSLKFLETGADDITLQTENGNIELKGTVEILSGKKILDSAGAIIQFGDSLGVTGSIEVSGTVDGIDLQQFSSSVSNLNINNDSRLGLLETASGSIINDFNTYTSSNNTTNTTQNNRIGSLEVESGSIRSEFNDFTSSLDTALEFTGSDVTIKGNLLVKGTESRINSTTIDVNDNIISLNGSGAVFGGLEVRDVTAPGVVSGSLLWDSNGNYWIGGQKGTEVRFLNTDDLTTLNVTLGTLQTESGSIRGDFNSYTQSNNSTNSDQNRRLDGLDIFSGSAKLRLNSIETLTSSLASISSVTDVRDDFNTYTSSNDATNNTQNGKLGLLETASGSIRRDFNDYTSSNNSLNNTQNGRLSSLENASGSVRNELNNYTSSNNTTNTNQNGRLTSLEVETGSINSNILTLDGRIEDVEITLGQLDSIYATDGDVTNLRNDLNAYTSSTDGRQSTQDGRLNALETKTGSLDTDITAIDSRLDSLEGVTGSFITGYTETQTLDDVTDLGSTTTNSIGVGGLDSTGAISINSTNVIDDNRRIYGSGTASNTIPAFTFAGDTNTGLSRIGEDAVGLVAAGSRKFYVSNTHAYFQNLPSGVTINGAGLRVEGNATITGSTTAGSFIKSGGSPSEFLKADGSVDENTYLTAHPSVVAATSSNNSGRTYIQDILLDSFGHISGITTATETVVNTDLYTTGATFNNSNGILTFTKNNSDTYTVNLASTLTDVTVTGGTYDSGSQTLRLTKSDGNSVSVSGFAIDTDVNWYSTGATFNSTNGIITFTRNDGGTFTVDIDGKYAESGHNHDADYVNVNGDTMTGNLKVRGNINIEDGDLIMDSGTVNGTNYRKIRFTEDIDSNAGLQGGFIHYNADDNFFQIGTHNTSDTNVLNDVYHISMTRGTGDVTINNNITASSFIKRNGTSSQFLMADGSVSTNPGWLTAHPSVSAATSSNNSGRTYIQDILLDGFGHITGLTTATETVVNTDTNNFTTGATFSTVNGIITFTRNNGNTYTVDLDGRYLQSYTETDPIFTASDAFNIRTEDITNWNIAYGWGDHATRGYLTSYVDTNNFTTGATFNTSDGVITFTKNDGGIYNVDIDGRYLTAVTGTASGQLNMNNFNITNVNNITIGDPGPGEGINWGGGNGWSIWESPNDLTTNTSGNLQFVKNGTRVMTIDTSNNVSVLGLITASGGDSSQWNTAYGWGDHSTRGYLTSYTDTNNFTTGSTFNSTSGILTFTRNNGDTYTVNLSATLTDVTVTGGTYNSGNQTLTLTKSNGSTVAVSGFAIDTDVNWYTNSATFNASNGIITGTRNDGGTWTVDIDGRYLTVESDTLQTVTSRGATTTNSITIDDGTTSGSSSSYTAFKKLIFTNSHNDIARGPNKIVLHDNGAGWQGGLGVHSDTVSYYSGGAHDWYKSTSSGYTLLGSLSGTGVLYVNGGNSGQWNTAYGWGNHATRGYLTTHPSVSSAASSNNGGRTYIQDILLDSFGHITGITTATETVVNTDTNYYTTGATFNTGNGIITGTRNDGGTWSVDLDGRYLTSYTETDTFANVVSRGNSTSSNIRVKRPSNKVDNNGNPIEFGGRVEFNNDFVSGESGYMAFRYPTYNNFLIAGDYDGNIGGGIPNIQFGKQSTVYIHMNSSNGYTGYNTTTPQKRLDIYNGSTRGIFASFGSTFSPNEFGGIHFGYSESGLGNDSYKKSALVFERTDNHGQGGNASGRIHFLLNNRASASADSIAESVMVIDTDASATQGSARVTIGKTGTTGELVVNGTITATGGNSGNWNAAYGWGDHSTRGYLTSYTDTNNFTTGATFNTGNGIITFTRNNGNTYTVDIDGKYAESVHTHDDRYFTETESDARYPLSRGAIGTSTTVGDATGFGNNKAAGTYTRGYVGHGGQVMMSHDTGGSVGNVGIETTYYGAMYVHANVDSSSWVTKQIWTSYNFTSTNITNWDTAYGWGDHSTRGYLTSHPTISGVSSNNSGRTYIQDILTDANGHITGVTTATETVVNTDTNYYTTGSTFNSTSGILTFTRNNGGSYTVDISATLTDVTVTGGTYNSGTQTLRLTKSNGTTLDVSGFAIDTDVNWYVTGATFNTGNGIISLTRNDGTTVTVDIDGKYAESAHTHTFASLTSKPTTLAGYGITDASSSGHNHDGTYVRSYTTSAGDIDADWGQSFKTFDPIPTGTPPRQSPNIRTINVGNDFNRRTQLAFDYATDQAWFRRRNDSGWQTWREFIHSGNISTQSVSYADSAGTSSSATTSSQLTVNSGNTSAGWYPITWHSGNTVYSSSGVEIYAAGNYIRSTYINTSDNDETDITRFVIKNGDNYHRSATATTAANVIRGVASGSWGINITGSAASATTATNLGADYTADDWFRATGDNNPVKFYGNTYQMTFRTDGASEAYSGIGGYPFVWSYGGSTSETRIMLLADTGRLWTKQFGWLDEAFASSAQGTNADTAYGWGNHASGGYATLAGSNSFTNSYNEFGNGTGSVSNDGSWNGRVNIAGTQHARLDVKSVSDGIITTMLSHIGHGAGKVGTYSNHPLKLVINGLDKATLDSSGNFTLTGSLTASGYNPTSWDTAYGWGNHASGGYIVKGSTVAETSSWADATKFRSNGDISQTTAGNHSLQVYADINNDAFMAFHISSDYAVYFGLENATNRLYTGGWSTGADKHQIWDSRDFSSTNISNWNTSYGWGNHAGLYLSASGKAADSELLDGVDSGYYVKSGAGASVSGWLIDAFRNGSGTSPRIYMSSNSGYGMHINTYNTSASVYGLEIHNNAMTTFMVYNDGDVIVGKDLEVTGDLKMQGTDSYIWTPNTSEGFTGFWDQYNSRIAANFSNNVGWGFLGDPESGYAIKSHGSIRTTGSVVASGSVNSGNNFYADQNYGYGLVGLYNSTRYQGVFAMGDSYKLTADGTGTGTLYGIAWTHSNVGGQSKSGLGHQALFMMNGQTYTAIGSGIWTDGNVEISNSTGSWFKNGNAWFGRNHAYDTAEIRGYGSELMIGSQGTDLHINFRTCNNGTANHTPTNWYWRAGSSTSYSNHFFGQVRAQSFVTVNGDRVGSGTLSVRSGGAGGVGWGTGLNLGDSSSYYSVIQDTNISRFRNYGGGGYQWFNSSASVAILELTNGGDLLPYNGVGNLGSSTRRWANIYTNDLHLSNEGKVGGNDVDGTTGSWTIQEGSEDLYLINNKNGKKYKISLSEV